MKERPLIFSKPMIKSILAGTKTQTRRVLKVQPAVIDGVLMHHVKGSKWQSGLPCVSPYGVQGDRLWVRETCRAEELKDLRDGVRYLADDHWEVIGNTSEAGDKWLGLYSYQGVKGATVPSIFMPRWASRITLEITNVRCQRLQEISEEDAMEEGIVECEIPADDEGPIRVGYMVGPDDGKSKLTVTACESFQKLWDSINGKRHPWLENQFVWALTFKRV